MTDSSNHPSPAVAAGAFRQAFRRYPAGVAVITSAVGDSRVGLTVTSLRSLSAEPPLVGFGVSRTASTHPGITRAERFLVHVLGHDHQHLAERFSRSGIDRFAEIDWSLDEAGLPRLHGPALVLTCTKTQQLPLGDGDLVVGLVTGIEHEPERQPTPLVYHDGGYLPPSSTPSALHLQRVAS
jgi:flavin reductase (DIM6/NTAB) family NADH-FMN oxidoreductase RutF